jgi:hypothetical protein
LGLKNLVRVELSRHGQRIWELRTLDAEPVHAFTVFCEKNSDYSPRTQKRYAEAVSRFLDYLYEAQVFGHEPVTASHLNNIVEAYPLLLRDGSDVTARRVIERATDAPHDLWLAKVAQGLRWKPISPAGFSNTLAGINRFLLLSESLSQEAYERARLLGVDHLGRYERLFKALDGTASCCVRFLVGAEPSSASGTSTEEAESRGAVRRRTRDQERCRSTTGDKRIYLRREWLSAQSTRSRRYGGVAERFKALVLKTSEGATLP